MLQTDPHPGAFRGAVTLFLAASALALAGCSDGTGGAAGDEGFGGPDIFTPSPIEPFVGVWDITGDWNGVDGDQALLVIRPVNADGEADALIYDFVETDGCYFIESRSGKAVPDELRGQRVFLENVGRFYGGELDRSGATLVITHFPTDSLNADLDDRVRYLAPSVGLTETDVGPPCFAKS